MLAPVLLASTYFQSSNQLLGQLITRFPTPSARLTASLAQPQSGSIPSHTVLCMWRHMV